MYYVSGNDNDNNTYYNLNASTYDLLERSLPGCWFYVHVIACHSVSTATSSVSCHHLSPGC